MKNNNFNWELGRGYNLRAMSLRWIKNGVRELELFLVGRGPGPGGSSVELRQAELCLRVFEAELRRRAGRARAESGGLFGV